MKRLISLLTAAALAAALAGCSSADSSSSAPSETASVTSAETAAQSSAVTAATDVPAVSSEQDHQPLKPLPELVSPFPADTEALEQTETPMPEFEKVAAQYEEGKDSLDKKIESFSSKKDHPCINITTQDKKKILSKDEYVASVIDVFNCGEEFRLTAEAGVKVRGNSTADQGDEKPYRIKFSEKHNMLGLHGGAEYKSWVLLRSYWNLAPDYMGFSLAKEIFGGKYYSSDFMYVNLYINGYPRGVYLLCEQNQAAKGRIEVNEPKKDETQAEIGYLVEMDNYPSEEHPYFYYDHLAADITDISGKKRQFIEHAYSVRSDINTKGQLSFIENYVTGCFRILYAAVIDGRSLMFDENGKLVSGEGYFKDPFDAVCAVIDIESLANMLILEELVHNNDVGAGSFYMAVDFSEGSKYKKLTFLAPWDFNWAYEGDANGGYYASTFQKLHTDGWDRSNPWFILAMKSEAFTEAVKAKWAELTNSKVLTKTTAKVVGDCETLRKDLGNNDAWKIDQAKNIAQFVSGRIKWLNSVWTK